MHTLWTRCAAYEPDIPTIIHSGYVDFINLYDEIHISTVLITITPS